jgi:DNA-binding response OmpR family regulator
VTHVSSARPAVLVVEDEADLAATYRRLFGHHGLRVVIAGTRDAALRALEEQVFAVAIVDVRLPDGDGLDVVRKVREMASPAPAIVVTGFASQHLRQAALAAGASDFFAKPFDAAALAARVRSLSTTA